jgi:deoxyhypusine synthase
VVCYVDSTIALPLLTSYALATRKKRPLRRLYDRRAQMMKLLREEFERSTGEPVDAAATDSFLPQHR